MREPVLRVQIVSPRSECDEDPESFRKQYEQSQNALTQRIVEARKLVKQVGCTGQCLNAWPRS